MGLLVQFKSPLSILIVAAVAQGYCMLYYGHSIVYQLESLQDNQACHVTYRLKIASMYLRLAEQLEIQILKTVL